jgi:clan AA aspartic protease (TIGR02281 family)
LANAYAELFQVGLMENVLASLALDDPAAQKIRQILITQQTSQPNIDDSTEPELSTKNTRSIPLKHIGDHYVVNASLSSNPVTLLIDTGASITAISRAFYDNLSNRYKINFLGRFNINTAGGRIMAPMYQFRELTIQHITLQNITVVIIPMQGMEHADGLLGMNFLREFDFKIDQAHSVLFLD